MPSEDKKCIQTDTFYQLQTEVRNENSNIDGGTDFPAGFTDTATVTMDLPEATKSIVATSETHTSEDGDGTTNNNAGRRKLAIGEIIRYRLVATLPEGTANNFQLRDRVPGGLLFLDDDTTKVAFVSDDAPITSVDTTTSFSNPLTIGLGSPGTFDEGLWKTGTSDTGITPSFTLDKTNYDANIGNNNDIGNNNSSDVDPDNYFSGTDVYFKFGDITNPDRDADDEYVIVEFNALVTNDYTNSSGTVVTDNDSGENRNNRFQINVGTGTNFDTADELVRSDTIYSRIVEPSLSLTKEVGSTTSSFSTDTLLSDSGNTVYFRLTFDNATNVNQNASAFDVTLADTVPTGLTLVGIESITWDDGDGSGGTGTENTPSSGAGFTAGDMTITPTFDTGAGTVSIDVDEMPTSSTISVIYSVNTIGTVNPDQLLTNTADITYSSLPGDDSDGSSSTSPGTSRTDTANNPTGSDVNDTTSGDTLSERNGDDTTNSANDYTVDASASVKVEPLVPIKSLVSTSESDTTGDDVAIGEIVRYRLAVTIPEGTSTAFTIEDNLPPGLLYLNDNTTKIAFIADEGGISSSNSSINSITDINVSGTSIVAPDADAVLISSSITDGNDDSFTSGENPIFNLGNLTNSDNDSDDDEYVVIEFNALVENITDNTDGGTNDPLSNTFTVSATGSTPRTSDPITVDIVEPSITNVVKSVSSSTADAGDTLTYTVTFTNTGTATAYDVNITDTLPSELENLTNIQLNSGTTGFTDNSTGTALDILLTNGIAVNESVTITFDADVVSTVAPDSTFTSDVTVDYTSLPGDDANAGTAKTDTANNPTGSDVNNTTSGDTNSERNSSTNGDGASVNNYTDSNDAPVTVTIDPLAAVKSLVSTSESDTTGDDVAIGEIVRYRLAVTIPEGASTAFTIEDNLPPGLLYLNDNTTKIAFIADGGGISSSNSSINSITDINVSGTSIVAPDADAVLITSVITDGNDDSFTSGENPIFNLGTLTNSDNDSDDDEYVVIEFNALVENITDNTDGGTNDPLSNTFTVSATGSTSRTSDPVTVDIVEPVITSVTHDVSSSTADAGNTLTYTVEFTNTGTATAFDVNVAETLPSGLDSLSITSTKIFDADDNEVTGSFTITPTSTNSTDDTSTDSPDADAYSIDINELPVGYRAEVIYSAIVVGDIAPDAEITNTANVTYSSLPGDDNDGSSSTSPGTPDTNPTGSDVNATTSGNTNSERNSSTNGEGASVNDYTVSSSVKVDIDPLNLTKSLVNTDVGNDTSTEVLINETLTYRILVDVPEGQISSFSITDTLPNGLTYVENSGKVALVGDTNTNITSNQIAGTSAFISDAASISNITPTFSFEPSGTPFTSGEDIVFDLGLVTNNDNDGDTEYVVIEFEAKIDNPGDNSGSLDNVFSLGGNDSNTITVTVDRDYGDAPDSGGTNSEGNYDTTSASSGASHYVTNGLTVGVLVDDDDGTLQNDTATADEANATADEDGVDFSTITPLNINKDNSYSVTVDVNNTTGADATLVGWIDFNQNGVFEASEAATATVTDGTTNADADVTLTWSTAGGNLPAASNIGIGNTYARFRLSTDDAFNTIEDSDSVGSLQDGEVEDYQLNIGIDYGDAPDSGGTNAKGNYDTTDASGGAAHAIVDGLTIGSTIDDDSGTLQNDAATADDGDGTADEDGVTISATPLKINQDSSYSVTVDVNNTTGADATLVGWIDFDQDGVFEASEAVSATVPNGTTTASPINLTWDRDGGTSGSGFGVLPDVSTIAIGDTYARFRLSTDAAFNTIEDADSVGFLADGEVEDYKLNIGVDYGDAPDSGGTNAEGNYDTTDASGGAAHAIVDGLTIGSTIDDDSGTLQNDSATADDGDGTADEDGVTISATPLNINKDNSYSVTVDVNNTTGADATLVGWIDFDQDGVFEASEAATATVTDGTTNADADITLTWSTAGGNLPAASNIEIGDTYARFRLSSDPAFNTIEDADSVGFLADGEVEDYKLNMGIDYGDATNSDSSDSYAATTTSHGIVDGLTIGSAIDDDSGSLQNDTATADDTDGSPDDEDGITINNLAFDPVNDSVYTIDVDVNNTTGEDATLVGWIDFDQDGEFEAGEAISKTISTNNSSQNIELKWDNNDVGLPNLPAITPGDTYARFRLSTDAAFNTIEDADSVGFLADGEVEDYPVTIYNEVSGHSYPESLTGTTNDDYITGEEGQDTLTGGDGADVFVYNKTSDSLDVITDFVSGTDKLDFTSIVDEIETVVGSAIPDPIGSGYITWDKFNNSGTLVRVDFDAAGSLNPKPVVFLQSTDDSLTLANTDFIL